MAELPTKEELEQLYHEKGHDALVWYAWRCALRASPSLGFVPFERIWRKDAHKYVFAVLRPLLMLGQWKNNSKTDLYLEFFLVTVAAHAAADGANGCTAVCKSIAHASSVASSIDAMTAANHAYKVASYSNTYANIAACIEDFNRLKKQTSIDGSHWLSFPLWPDQAFYIDQSGVELKEFLLVGLESLGLGFVGNDLQSLWRMKALGEHAVNYFRKLSNTISNDPVALKEAILFGGDAAEKLQVVRVLLLGPGGAGKSSLRDRLIGRSINENVKREATTGVEYEWLVPAVLRDINPKLDFDSQLNLRLWDFGGQTIFHGLHRAFLHENCVYVLVVDSRHEQAPDGWLYQIQDLSGDEKPQVLIVTNRYDNCDTRQNETRLLREFPDLLSSPNQFFYFSCHQSNEPQFRAFIQALIDQSMNSRHQVLKLAVDVQRKMTVKFKDQVFLEEQCIEGLIPEHLVDKFYATVINHLDQLGYMIPVEEGETTYCLKPEWAIQHAYELVHSKALRGVEGIAPKRTLQQILKGKVSSSEVNCLIQFLRSRHLCQKLNNNQYFFPDSAPEDEPVEVREIQNEKEALALRFDLPFLPLGIHTRIIHQLFKAENTVRIPDTKAIWRQGFLLECGSARSSVQYQWRKSTIEIRMAGEVERFADILEAFDTALDAALERGVLRRKEVQPYILYDYDDKKRVYSIDSSAELAKELRGIKHIRQLFPEEIKVPENQTTIINNGPSQNSIGDHNTNTQHNNQPHTEVNTDQRQQIAAIASELLKDAATLPTEQLGAVFEVKKALDAPQEDEKSQGLLGRVWQGINDSIGLAANSLTAADLALKYKDPILAAFAGATTFIGS